MYFVVQNPPLRREHILTPLLLNVDQRALAFAEKQMLKSGKGKKVVFGVHLSF